MTVQRHMRADPQFREAVRACREQRVPDAMVALAEPDWRAHAGFPLGNHRFRST